MTWQEKILEKIKIIKCLKRERGSILVLTALLLPILFGCLGIAYDVGTLYMHKARLQNVADAAALAGGRAYLQSQKKDNNNDKDTYDPYTNGNITDEEYVIGGSKTRVRRRPGEDIPDDDNIHTFHLDADNAADVYIYNNIINLGNKVYSDKFSHYALPGYKKRGDDYVNADEIFYRIGLYEKVPLYFLPVITNKNVEIVRAGSVVVVVPEETEVREWDEYIPGTGGTPTATSLFDKLFVVRERINFDGSVVTNPDDPALGQQSKINATFVGDTVYTGNTWDSSKYHTQGYNGSYLFSEEEAQYKDRPGNEISIMQLRSIPNTGSRMVMDNSIDIDYYVNGFREKLKKVHYDLQQNDAGKTFNTNQLNNLPLQSLDNIYTNSATGEQMYQRNDDGTYSQPCSNTPSQYLSTFYNVTGNLYYKCNLGGWGFSVDGEGWKNVKTYVADENDNQIFFEVNGGTTNFYRGFKGQNAPYTKLTVQSETSDNANELVYSYVHNGQKIKFTIEKIEGVFTKVSSVNSSVYHKNSGSGINVNINGGLDGAESNPIYVIIDKDCQQTNLTATVSNERPVIFCYLGTEELNVKIESGCTFKGLIYAPNCDTQIKNKGSFIGNIVSNIIKVYRDTEDIVHFTQKNFVVNDSDLNTVPETAAAAQEARKQQAIAYAKAEFAKAELEFLGVNDEAWNDKDWLSKEENAGKLQAIQEAWYNARMSLWQNTGLDMPDWPWSTGGKTTDTDRHHYSVETGGGSTPGQTIHHTETVVLTSEVFRLINYRTDYQPKETIQENDVLDPYIYETLGQPNTY